MSRTRDPVLLAVALTLGLLGVWCTAVAIDWIGKPFPSFLVLDNGIVHSRALSDDSVADLHGLEVVRVGGRSLVAQGRPGAALRDAIVEVDASVGVEYQFRRGEESWTRVVPVRLFGRRDFVSVFAFFLLAGIAAGAMALSTRILRGRDAVAYGLFVPLVIGAIYSFASLDVYGPGRLLRLHAAAECFLFAAVLHMAVAVPTPAHWAKSPARWVALPYVFAFALAVVTQSGLFHPGVYRVTHQLSMGLAWLGVGVLAVSQIARFLWSPSFETRQRVKMLGLGTLVALGPPFVLATVAGAAAEGEGHDWVALAAASLPIAIGWAVLRHDLVAIDALVRRSLGYAMLGLVVVVAYVGGLAALDGFFFESDAHRASGIPFVLGVACALVLMSVRDRLQRAVNQRFFPTTYDLSRTVERSSRRMSAVTDLQVIADEVVGTVGGALHPGWVAFYLRRKKNAQFEILESPPRSVNVQSLLEACEEAHSPVEDEDANLAVPFRVEGQLKAVLMLGARRPFRLYTGDDRRLLQILANQGALAIQNALAIDELQQIHHELEWRVNNRTRELDHVLADLREKNQLLEHLSFTDAVTNLRNRAYLDDALEMEFARAQRYGSSLSVLMADIDHFKRVNDRHGHQAGDEVLRKVGELIQQNLRSSDVAGRYGGEEFMIILAHGSPSSGALIFGERLRGGVEMTAFPDLEGGCFEVTLSIGVATLRVEHATVDDLVAAADAALYRAKSNGRNRVEVESGR